MNKAHQVTKELSKMLNNPANTCPYEGISGHMESGDIYQGASVRNNNLVITIERENGELYELELVPISWKKK